MKKTRYKIAGGYAVEIDVDMENADNLHSNKSDLLYPDFEKQYAEIRKLTPTLGERLKEIQAKIDIKNKEAIHKTGLSDAMVGRLRNDSNARHDMLTMVKLCAGLDLPPQIARELCALAGVALNASNKLNFAYQIIIEQMHGRTAEEKERFLEQNGFPRLDIQD